jgi:DNA polymerase III delta prime subunit
MLTLEQRKELLTLFRQTPSEDGEWLNFEGIQAHFPTQYKPRDWAKLLCALLDKGMIKVRDRRGEEEGLFISLIEKKKQERELIDDIREALLICESIEPPKSLLHFHRLTSNRFRKTALLQLLEQVNASVLDLRVICRYVEAFFANEMPFSLNDLKLGKRAFLELNEQVAAERFMPELQDLIRLERDRCSIWFENVPTPRLSKLLRDEPIPVIQASRKRQQGLLTEIQSAFLPRQELCFNAAEQELFHDLQRLILRRSPLEEGALSVLLHGPSGTGKTAFVHQLARQAGADVLQLNFEAISSKWIGETQKNIQSVFDTYRNKKKGSDKHVFLLLNEADSLMNRRVQVTRSNDGFHNQNQTQLLQVLEDFEGIVFATTNLYKNIDEAFHRRFLFHLEVKLPERDTRERLLTHSPLHTMVSGQLRQALLEAVWSPAELKNAGQKVQLFRTMYDNWDESRLERLLQESGLLRAPRKLGFSTRNPLHGSFSRDTHVETPSR